MEISDLDTITFSDIEPDSERKTTEDVSQYLRNFEESPFAVSANITKISSSSLSASSPGVEEM